MGGEQSAFRSLVPSASTAAIAFLTRLREQQIQQQVLEMNEKENKFSLPVLDWQNKCSKRTDEIKSGRNEE